jgi:hypothetical protein
MTNLNMFSGGGAGGAGGMGSVSGMSDMVMGMGEPGMGFGTMNSNAPPSSFPRWRIWCATEAHVESLDGDEYPPVHEHSKHQYEPDR